MVNKTEKSVEFSLRTIKICRFEIIDGVEYVYCIKHAYKFLLREQVGFAAVLWRLRQGVSCDIFYIAYLNLCLCRTSDLISLAKTQTAVARMPKDEGCCLYLRSFDGTNMHAIWSCRIQYHYVMKCASLLTSREEGSYVMVEVIVSLCTAFTNRFNPHGHIRFPCIYLLCNSL